MKLVVLGEGRWRVHAIVIEDGSCPVLDLIAAVGEHRAKLSDRMLADLQDHVPRTDQRDWTRDDFSKSLGKGIYEFRWPTPRGGTPRVLWFFDKDRLIVCATGEDKKGKLSATTWNTVLTLQHRYEAARDAGTLKTITIDQLDQEQNSEGR